MTRISTSSLLAMASLAGLLAGCNPSSSDNIGPAQRAGKAVDEAGAKVTSAVEHQVVKADAAARQAREKVQDATTEASRNLDHATAEVGKKVERAGEKLQEAAH
jgi:predicted small secreted protein